MFTYEQVYWLESPWESDDALLTGAALDPEWGWTFWRGDSLDDITTRSFKFSSIDASKDGTVVGRFDKFAFKFRPVTPEEVRANPSRYGVTDTEAAKIHTTGDVYLYLHAARVADWYEQRYSLTESVSESVEQDYLSEQRGVAAPVGSLHFWTSRNKWFKKMPNGLWMELSEGPSWSHGKIEGIPENTLDAYSENGVLLPYRKELHDKIISRLFRGKDKTKNPTAVLTMGLPAAGKSALSSYLGRREQRELVVLDPDSHRAALPEYRAAVDLKSRDAAAFVHNEVTLLNDTALEKAMTPDQAGESYSFLLDGVGANLPWYKALIRALKERGYSTQLLYAHVGNSEELDATDRVKVRAEDRGIRTGRFVAPNIIERFQPLLPANFEALAKEVDNAAAFDMTDPENPSERLTVKGGEMKGDTRWMREASESPVTPLVEESMQDAFTKTKDLYRKALVDDEQRHREMKVKYAPGEGVEDPVADPVNPAAPIPAFFSKATSPDTVLPKNVKLVDGKFYEQNEHGEWALEAPAGTLRAFNGVLYEKHPEGYWQKAR